MLKNKSTSVLIASAITVTTLRAELPSTLDETLMWIAPRINDKEVEENTALAFKATPIIPKVATNTDAWVYTSPLIVGRSGHTATLLTNGKVLVAGGSASTITELYEPSTRKWTATGSLTTVRYGHTATLLTNGKVLVVGGLNQINGNNNYLSNSELYDPSTGNWSTTGALANTCYSHTATLLANGKVLVVGGGYNVSSYLSSAELYDPSTGTWRATGVLANARSRHTATLLNNGKVLVVGGDSSINGNTTWLSSAELYNPSTGNWSTTGALANAPSGHTATLLNNGKVLMVDYFSTELYNPTTGIWSTAEPLITLRGSYTATLLTNGKVLVAGGYQGGGLSNAELYDPSTGHWNNIATLNTARYEHQAMRLTNGQVLVIGGYDGGGVALNSAELYWPIAANTAITLSDDRTSVNTGETITYTITVTNNGPAVATGSTILKAPAVTNLTVSAITCNTVNYNGATCPGAISVANLQGAGIAMNNLPVSGQISFKITATLAAATPSGNLNYTATLTAPASTPDSDWNNNTAVDSDRVISRPDFVITNMVLNPASAPNADRTFSAAVTIKNQGGLTANAGVLSLWFDQLNPVGCRTASNVWAEVGAIAANATKTIIFNTAFNTEPVIANWEGVTLRAFIDSTCITGEVQESNNQFTRVYGAPDLSITNVGVTPAVPSANGTFSATVIIKNSGSMAVDGAYLDVWADKTTASICNAEGDAWIDIGNIAAGANKILTVTGIPAGVAGTNRTVQAFVDSWCEIAEPNEADNQFIRVYRVQ